MASMPIGPGQQLQPPGSGQTPQGGQGPGPGGGMDVSPNAGRPDPYQRALLLGQQITSAAGRLGMSYPEAMEEVRQINDLVARIHQKIVASRPAPQPQAPPG